MNYMIFKHICQFTFHYELIITVDDGSKTKTNYNLHFTMN